MQITVKKLTDVKLMQRACEMTMHGQESGATLDGIYRCEHSPIRTQMFWIEMLGIPTFVSVHFVRHKIGVEHFVMSNREDLGGDGEANRQTPVNHGMWLNAQALINMARKRLCRKSHDTTRKVMIAIRNAIIWVDSDLGKYMIPECVYRQGCHESKSCGFFETPPSEFLFEQKGEAR